MPRHASPRRPDEKVTAAVTRYWRRNLLVMTLLLVIWAAAGLGCGVLLADSLNSVHWGGFPLGFWFAQQGSILVFLLLILVYALVLNRLDAAHHAEMEDSSPDSESDPA